MLDRLDETRTVHEPRPERLPNDPVAVAAIRMAHDVALLRGESTYRDPMSGLFVLTAKTLAARGTCCRGGCRHCPYA